MEEQIKIKLTADMVISGTREEVERFKYAIECLAENPTGIDSYASNEARTDTEDDILARTFKSRIIKFFVGMIPIRWIIVKSLEVHVYNPLEIGSNK